jgi:hypothetical protein
MKIEEYVSQLESISDPELVSQIAEWPLETKLYMYLHNIQLTYMTIFLEKLNDSQRMA